MCDQRGAGGSGGEFGICFGNLPKFSSTDAVLGGRRKSYKVEKHDKGIHSLLCYVEGANNVRTVDMDEEGIDTSLIIAGGRRTRR